MKYCIPHLERCYKFEDLVPLGRVGTTFIIYLALLQVVIDTVLLLLLFMNGCGTSKIYWYVTVSILESIQ